MLKIRFSRVGRKKQPFFKIIVIPKSAPPTGSKFKDQVGTYNPVTKEAQIDHDKARAWIAQGAQPSSAVFNLFVKYGVIAGKKVAVHGQGSIESSATASKQIESKKEVPIQKEPSVETDKEKEMTKKQIKESQKETEQVIEEKSEQLEEAEKEKEDDKVEEGNQQKEKNEKDLEELGLNTRIINTLNEAGIESIKALKNKTADDLAEIKGLGEKSIEAILEKIK